MAAGLTFDAICAAIRLNTAPASCVRRLAAAARARSVADPSLADVPLLHDLHGYGPALEWGLALVDDLAAWRRGELAFTALDRCVVLASEPGLGKTTFARSLAKTAGLPLVATSIGDMFAQSPGFLDSIIKELAAALRPPPCARR